MLAFCGIECSECGAFQATKDNDNVKRVEVAAMWSKQFNADIKPSDINCDGCQSENGVLFSHCLVCEIRNCAKTKKVENCGYCNEYPCNKLNMIFDFLPEAKIRLDSTNTSL